MKLFDFLKKLTEIAPKLRASSEVALMIEIVSKEGNKSTKFYAPVSDLVPMDLRFDGKIVLCGKFKERESSLP